MKSMTDYFADWFSRKYTSIGRRAILTETDMELSFQAGWQSRINTHGHVGWVSVENAQYKRDQQDLAKYRREVPGLDKEIERLRNVIRQQSEQIGKLHSRVDGLISHNEKLESGNGDRRKEVEARDRDIANLIDANSVLQRRNSILGQNEKQLYALVDNKDEEIKRLTSWGEDAEMRVRQATAERDDWHQAYDKLVSDVVHGRHIPGGKGLHDLDAQYKQIKSDVNADNEYLRH